MEFIFGVISQVIFLCQNWNLTNPATEQHLSEMSKHLSTFRQPPSHYSCGIHGWLRESHLTDAKNKIPIWKIQLLISQPSSPAISLPFCTGMQPVASKKKKKDTGFFTIATQCVGFESNLPILYYTHDPQTLFILIPRIKNSGSLHQRGLMFYQSTPPLLPSRETTVLVEARRSRPQLCGTREYP